jgi:hypothetical protein
LVPATSGLGDTRGSCRDRAPTRGAAVGRAVAGNAGSAGVASGSGGIGSGGIAGAAGSVAAGGTAGSGGNAGAAGSVALGGAAGSAGSSGGAPGVAGAGGGPAKSCTELNADYVQAVALAKHCVYGTIPNPCSVKTKSDLECECPTFINPSNTPALSEMATIEATWTLQGCPPKLSCLCANPQTGYCTPGPGGPANGTCQDG